MDEIQHNEHDQQKQSAVKVTDMQTNNSKSPRTSNGKNGNKKKRRKRKRSEKQMERWRKYKEAKYAKNVQDAVSNPAVYGMVYGIPYTWRLRCHLPYQDTRLESQAIVTHAQKNISDPLDLNENLIPGSISPTATSLAIVSKLSAEAPVFVPRSAARNPENPVDENTTRANELAGNLKDAKGVLTCSVDTEEQKMDSRLKAIANVVDPSTRGPPEQVTDDQAPEKITENAVKPIPLPEVSIINERFTSQNIAADDMFGILSVYVDSDIHADSDKMTCKMTTKEDFGYVYFSLCNLTR